MSVRGRRVGELAVSYGEERPAVPGSGEGDVKWFPNHQVAELVWRKSLAMSPRRTEAG